MLFLLTTSIFSNQYDISFCCKYANYFSLLIWYHYYEIITYCMYCLCSYLRNCYSANHGLLFNLNFNFMLLSYFIQHIEAETKWPSFSRQHFQINFLEWKFINFIKILLKFVPKGPINNIPALIQIMACRWPGDKPLSELMLVSLLTHRCVTRPQCVNAYWQGLDMQVT